MTAGRVIYYVWVYISTRGLGRGFGNFGLTFTQFTQFSNIFKEISERFARSSSISNSYCVGSDFEDVRVIDVEGAVE